jgi:predicted ester cyclase
MSTTTANKAIMRCFVEALFMRGDLGVTRWVVTGTHQGAFTGLPPTGKSARITAINSHRIGDGQVKEAWLNWDALGFMQQLGVIPTPG